MKSVISAFFTSILVFSCTTVIAQAQILSPAQRAQLQQELTQVEAEQKQAEADLQSAQGQSASLSKDIKVLDARIKTAQLNIKAKNLLIQTLGNDIAIKSGHIASLEARIASGKQSLADILRKTNELGAISLPEIVLSQSTVSGVFTDLDDFSSVSGSLQDVFDELRADEASTTAEKNALDTRRNAEMDARYAIQQEQKNIQRDQDQKKQLLAVSKGNEKSYASLVKDKQARAAQIRSALFSLRDSAAIPFGQALQYAQLASKKTGVRPAFILAIITQESSLGKNVGSCYLTDQSTGSGINARSGAVMSKVMSPRDIPSFVSILHDIGGDPTKTLVSCPQSIGWGGAMGPAQFIASTWVQFKDRTDTAMGISGMPDPWNPAHAIMTSAIYLSDLGAGNGGYTAEWNAACLYFSNRKCPTGKKQYTALEKNIRSYGNGVVSLVDTIQRTMIDPLQGY